jgi:hypothetical protein
MSAYNTVLGKDIPDWTNTAKAVRGTKLHHGTYIGVVKNVLDPNNLGRLQVWISELGGNADDSNGWISVRYASPFLGSTNTQGGDQISKNKSEKFSQVSQTYGMWMVPPDVNNKVLVTFANGDPNKGFWFACIFDRENHWAIPGNAGGNPGTDFNPANIEDADVRSAVKKLGAEANLPLAEYNRYDDGTNPLKVVNETLAASYINQGLAKDPVRGPGRSSSQRDMPSAVFGFSTPGRPLADPAITGVQTEKTYTRRGGHSFTMDDGEALTGAGQGIRLRTASGHQILMDDAEGTLYINNRDGSCFLEMSSSGHLSIYAGGGINIRSRGDFNLHSDGSINFHATKDFNLRSEQKVLIEGVDKVGVTGGNELGLFGDKALNLMTQKGSITLSVSKMKTFQSGITMTAGGDIYVNANGEFALQEPKGKKANTVPKPPPGITTYNNDDTSLLGKQWTKQKMAVESIVPIMPTHEPWDRQGWNSITRSQSTINGSAPGQDYVSGSAPAPTVVNKEVLTGLQLGSTSEHNLLLNPSLTKFVGVQQALQTTPPVVPSASAFTGSSAPNGRPIANNNIGVA